MNQHAARAFSMSAPMTQILPPDLKSIRGKRVVTHLTAISDLLLFHHD